MTDRVLAKKIKYLRHTKALTQSQLAMKAGVTRTTITNYETGYARPTPEQLDKLAEIFDVDSRWLTKTDDDFSYHVDEKEVSERAQTEFGKKLRLLRKNKKKTMDDLSKIINISRSGYSKYEIGGREPNLNSLVILADYFDVSLDDLLGTKKGVSNNKDIDLLRLVSEGWLLEIAEADEDKQNAIKVVWEEIKKL
ncbi:helix-turn-helix domain-containing protein [Paraliobacillus ryukyuensis]|uniref:helix-turn-helix domain-containing protein n=1 Tax=Paraliobacillus ryukyuensis TaxID=200904 RepID=UPI0009A8C74B|nr:helix-turn-helix transcriptional regulator [Paraliobacillus ryukyuensis]